MTQTPYTPRDPFAAEQVVGDQRVSGLAIGSFVTSLLCCIPGVGAIAAVLGIGALVSIGRSGGRLSGRALAFIAIVLGLLGTVGYIGIAIGLSLFLSGLKPYYDTITAIESGDFAAARQSMTPSAAQVTDEQLSEFRDQYRAAYGSPKSMPSGPLDVVKGWIAVGAGWDSMQAVQSVYPSADVIPLPARFDSGERLIFCVVQPSAGGGAPPLANIGVGGQQGTPVVWLLDPKAPPAQPPGAPSGPP